MVEQARASERQIPPRYDFTSQVTGVALKKATRELAPRPDQKEIAELSAVLHDFDKQGMDNMSVHESEAFPGVKIPYTIINTNETAAEIFGKNHEGKPFDPDPQKSETWCVFTGSQPPPKGHPFTPWDMAVDDAMKGVGGIMAQVKKGEQAPARRIIVFGVPTGVGGNATEPWRQAIEQQGFSIYGNEYATIIKRILAAERDQTRAISGNQEMDQRVVLHGISLGTVVTDATNRELHKELPQGVTTQVLLDNKVADHTESPLHKLRGIQLPVGLGLEFAVRMPFDRDLKGFMEGDAATHRKLYQTLKEKGLDPHTSPEELKFKRQVWKTESRGLMRGVKFDTGNKRYYIRRGIKDPLIYSPRIHAKAAINRVRSTIPISELRRKTATTAENVGDKSIEFAIGDSHFIHRARVGKWIRTLNFARSPYVPPRPQ